ncbi:hypothetical protein M2R29_21320 [Aeromonas hydrophila]|uniref:hypothetical protein n=1 Tax=Aeromonas hydrophila TaxID=644 RepID=UPI00207C6EE7|nr:hypothetical protein [Aeromonas hydrophila]MCO4210470.1 hypothetical protein [Aeromonas hydrophila]
MSDTTRSIKEALAEALIRSEENGDLVIATSVINNVTEPMAEAVKSVYAGIFTTQELAALSNLVFQATSDTKFYDWEMPTLVGYSLEEMQNLGEKLRELAIL